MRALVALLILAPVVALADAREHYLRGEALYNATRYEAALHEFEKAHADDQRPALVYDIARCLDKLGRREEAKIAYEKYLVDEPDAPNADEVRSRVIALSVITISEIELPKPVLVLTPVTPPSLPPRKHHSYLGPGLLGGGALVLGVVGAGLLGSALASYNDLSMACAPNCSSSTWAGLPARERAGEALLGIAGAMAVADVVWFVIERRRR